MLEAAGALRSETSDVTGLHHHRAHGRVLFITVFPPLVVASPLRLTCDRHNRPSCGNNQRQIALADKRSANENDGVWPYRPTLRTGAFAPKGSRPDDMATAIASFEFTVIQTGNQFTSKLFACPATPSCHPLSNSGNPQIDETPNSISNWVKACGCTNPLYMPGYCFDWSVPTNASAVLCGDCRPRGFDTFGHQSVTIVCYADNHVENTKQTPNTALCDVYLSIRYEHDASVCLSKCRRVDDAAGQHLRREWR